MDTINWLHLRALTLLALFGVFVMYALLAASLQNWHVKRRARRMTEQDASLPPKLTTAGGGDTGNAEPRAWLAERSTAEPARHAA